jgi:PIN domain nuclease of toxin-antitoxin system
VRHLIDTQILIWAIISPEKLAPHTVNILQSNEIFVSQISFLEIAIKQKIGKLPELDLPIASLANRAEQDGFNLLMLQTHHIDAYHAIPLFPDHRDPFDRIC